MDLSKMSNDAVQDALWDIIVDHDAGGRAHVWYDELARRLAAETARAEAAETVASGWLGKTLSARLIAEVANNRSGSEIHPKEAPR